jgi:hypothetical protein
MLFFKAQHHFISIEFYVWESEQSVAMLSTVLNRKLLSIFFKPNQRNKNNIHDEILKALEFECAY